MKAQFIRSGDTIPHSSVTAILAGAIIVLGTRLVAIAKLAFRPNAAGTLYEGELSVRGGFSVDKVTGAISKGAALYYDDNADPVSGDAGSGAFTTNSALGPFAGFAAKAALSGDAKVELNLLSLDAGPTTLRSALGQDDLQPYVVPVAQMQATGTGAQLGATAGTPAGAFGLTIGTFGTNSPKLVGEAASGNSKTDRCRFQFRLPPEYVSGETVTLRVKARITGNVQVAQTIDAEVYKSDNAAGIGSDLCATAAQTVTASFANYDFTVTPTGLAAGDTLDVQLTGVANDTGGTANKFIEIGQVAMLLDIKG